jgi:2,3-bisphosphoglycerate-independent phosphoglycerate mutase
VVRRAAVQVRVILDGASEPLGEEPTSLERARTPVLDGLAAEGSVIRLRTLARGLPAGSESAIPALLGWVPQAPVDRAAIEAAAHGIELGEGEHAWRVDRRDRADASATARMLARALAARAPARRGVPDHRVHHLGGHRMLIVGRDPAASAKRVPTLEAELLGIELRAGMLGSELLVWPRGATLPRRLGEETVVIGARGAAIGVARLMGARTVVPPGATGRPGTDLAAKAAAALAAIDGGATHVVVHVGAPDEAAHEHDAHAKVAAIEAVDAQLLARLADALKARRARLGDGAATLHVSPDHGCDPATGRHDDAPVPCLRWPRARARDLPVREGFVPFDSASGERLTERAVAEQAVTDLASLTSARFGRPHERPVVA